MVAVSIIMPARNSAATIEAAISSVRSQTRADWELLVVDDASGDDTAGVAGALAQHDARIRVIPLGAPQGAARARNAALPHARGRYIAFLDADDLWRPDKLERQCSEMERTGAALCYSGYEVRREGRADREISVPPSVGYEALLKGNVIGCLTAIYDTDICGKVPMPAIRRRHDFALWLTLLKRHGPARGVTQPLAIYRTGGNTLSARKIAATYGTWRMYRDVIGLSVPESLWSLSNHVWQRLRR